VSIEFLLDIFSENREKEAMVWNDRSFSYGSLLDHVPSCRRAIRDVIPPGSVVSLEADYSPTAVAMLLVLIERRAIVVPLASSLRSNMSRFREVAEVEYQITIDAEDRLSVSEEKRTPVHPLNLTLKKMQHPGLVLFSSGSTGQPKGALHDFVPLLEKFKVRRHQKRIIHFLLFDHIGGINTLFYTLSNGGCVITIPDRSPEAVLKAIADHRAQILPTSPTFINLLLASDSFRDYDLSSLELVTYGTEVMPESTLKRFHQKFPSIRLLQTYGLSELGILRSQSRSSDSLWFKIGGEGFQTRVVNGKLEIKAKSSMLGYYNAPSPFTEDGWFMTGDIVEVDGDYIRIVGRDSEVINVGGEKVYPAEVESVIQTMHGVLDISVSAESNPLVGQVVMARVWLADNEPLKEFRRRMRAFCRDKLEAYKIPQRIILVHKPAFSERFKRIRKEEY